LDVAFPYGKKFNLGNGQLFPNGAIFPIPVTALVPGFPNVNPGGAYLNDSPKVGVFPGGTSSGHWSFQMWYMARPVDSHGNPLPNSIWVPVKKVSWYFSVFADWSGAQTISVLGQHEVNGTLNAGTTNFTTTNQFPTWPAILSNSMGRARDVPQ
jgi:hypothetical protein